MRFEQLRYLDVTMREGSMRAAAGALGISQPSLSSQIQRLEEDLGVVLFVRTSHGVRPTDAADAVMPYVRAAIRAENALRQEASAITGLRAGRVRLGTISAASNGVLPSVVRRFQREHPNIHFQVTEGGSRRIRDLLYEDEFDVAVISRYARDPLDDARFRYIDLAKGHIVLAVPAGHPLAQHDSVRRTAVAGTSVIAFHPGYLLHDALLLLTQDVDVQIVYHTDSAETANRMVAAGVGISLASTLAAQSKTFQDIRYVRIDEPWAETRMSVVLRADEQPPPAVRGFLRMLREASGSLS